MQKRLHFKEKKLKTQIILSKKKTKKTKKKKQSKAKQNFSYVFLTVAF